MQIQKQFGNAASIRKNLNACLSRLFYFFKQRAKYVERSYEKNRLKIMYKYKMIHMSATEIQKRLGPLESR